MSKDAKEKSAPKKEAAPGAALAKRVSALEGRLGYIERKFKTELNIDLVDPERKPGGPAGDGAGEEQVVGNT